MHAGGLGRDTVVGPKKKMRKRSRQNADGVSEVESQTKKEEVKRMKHQKQLSALGDKPDVEKHLEELVFGGEEELVDRLVRNAVDVDAASGNLMEEDSTDSEVENEARDNFPPAKKPAWVDDDDEIEEEVDMTHRFRKDMLKSDAEKKLSKEKLKQRLREQFRGAMGGTPSWAEKGAKKKKKSKDNDDSEDEDDDDLLHKTGNFVATSEVLPRGIIQMKNCLNANHERPSDGRLTSVQFHPSAQVVMAAGTDHSISLFQVDGKTNPKIQSIYLERFPIYKARFSADGEQVIATSMQNKMFYVYDMMGGKIIPVYGVRGLEERHVKKFEVSPDGSLLLLIGTSGYLHLLTMKTKEMIGSLKINGKAIAAVFSPDGSKIYANSDDGDVYIWDVKSRKCTNRFTDEGCLHGTCIAVSRNGQYVACGSNSGVVNVYTHDHCLRETNPKPVKAIMNLVTAASSLAFNPSTEILAVASSAADDAVRLVHIPSFTVFSNFPVFRRKTIYLAQCMDFSPRSGFFSIATNKGKALLYRLKHYSDF
ncbi:U3 small nucleolar RNA-associated protein 18 homolog [Latimeria chalumnae]|uniref:U3 small nucleolar RNA-associated protein 18 homolog n=1 Tax=Latimeria chalumnae TaxID=7897 RepID=H3AAG2_LATCH|nr:PREDICTED: U3 small nucleolar RNA-associated protein 18 homolog [Latimeria chalumnae]|eukprot:XP_006001287.1 PREDICTED: U3 small nucleolar RNA-associated protein 18 homolog [Latimeria chalumnae]